MKSPGLHPYKKVNLRMNEQYRLKKFYTRRMKKMMDVISSQLKDLNDGSIFIKQFKERYLLTNMNLPAKTQ